MANYISKLITRYFNRRHNPETEVKIQQWLIDDEFSQEKDEALSQVWEELDSKADKAVYRSLKEVNAKIGIKPSRSWFLKHTLPRVAAVFIPLFAIAGVWLYQSTRIDMIEIATLAGEQKEIRLPDGSTVWLNACSKIGYPEKFSDSLRSVTLTGEAYFSVVRNERKRFEVTTKDITVAVLGTQFNVKAYPDDELVTTTLTSGKVAVQSPEEKYILRPNQELVYNIADKSAVVQGVSDNSTNWRDGSLIFNELTMNEIFKELERRFDVKFNYSQTLLPNDKYSIKFTNKENITQILDVFADVTGGGFTYTTNGKNIIITIE